jgi:hypothetical protein
MAKNDFPPVETKDAFGVHGKAANNKPASAYTGFEYPAGGGNDIGVYKNPMTNPHAAAPDVIAMSGNAMNELNVSVGGVRKGNTKPINQYGVGEMRGYGAANKGKKTSGKMG